MKSIFNIAKTELKTFFFSPIAWLVLAVFIFQSCSYFFPLFENFVSAKIMNYRTNLISLSLFTSPRSTFVQMYNQLYFYIPLLTMGVMSRELASGSIKLLYSSPVTDRQIIFGKYLGLLIYFFILLSIFLVFILLTIISAPNAEILMMLCSFLSMFILVATYAAIGLFISSMTPYSIVSAVGTFAILYLLSLVGNVAQDIEWVRDITYWLCIKGRGQEMLTGLFTTDSFLYFILLIGAFISLSIMRLRLRRQKVGFIGSTLRYVGIIAIYLIIGYVTSLPVMIKAYDTTPNKRLSLSPETQRVLKAIDGPLTITTYVNLLDQRCTYGLPKNVKSDMQRLRYYQIAKPDISFKYIYYYDKRVPNPNLLKPDNIGKSDLELAMPIMNSKRLNPGMFLPPEKMQEIRDLSDEEFRFCREVKCKKTGKTAMLRLYNDMMVFPKEQEYVAAFKRIITDNPPLVGFISGHGERSIYEGGDGNYNSFASALTQRYSLKNQGFNTTTIELKEGQPIPQNLVCVVLSDPRKVYEPWEIQQIHDYIQNGGNMIIACDSRRSDNVNPIIADLGVCYLPGMVVLPGTKLSPKVIKCDFTGSACRKFPTFQYLKSSSYYMFADSPAAIEFNEDNCKFQGFEFTKIAVSDSTGCWNELEKYNFDDEDPVYNAEAGEKQLGNPCLFACLQKDLGTSEDGKKKTQTIIILSTANAISNGEFNRNRGGRSANFNFVLESFGWTTNGEFPVDTSKEPTKDTVFLIGSKVLASAIKIVIMFVLPIILALFGVYTLRKRHKEL